MKNITELKVIQSLKSFMDIRDFFMSMGMAIQYIGLYGFNPHSANLVIGTEILLIALFYRVGGK